MRQLAPALVVVVVVVGSRAKLEAGGYEDAMDGSTRFGTPVRDAVEAELVDRLILDAGAEFVPDGGRPGRIVAFLMVALQADIEGLVRNTESEGRGAGPGAKVRAPGRSLVLAVSRPVQPGCQLRAHHELARRGIGRPGIESPACAQRRVQRQLAPIRQRVTGRELQRILTPAGGPAVAPTEVGLGVFGGSQPAVSQSHLEFLGPFAVMCARRDREVVQPGLELVQFRRLDIDADAGKRTPGGPFWLGVGSNHLVFARHSRRGYR